MFQVDYEPKERKTAPASNLRTATDTSTCPLICASWLINLLLFQQLALIHYAGVQDSIDEGHHGFGIVICGVTPQDHVTMIICGDSNDVSALGCSVANVQRVCV